MNIRPGFERGVVAVELAILASLIFLFMAGMLLFARAFHQYATLQNAVANSARFVGAAPKNVFGNPNGGPDLEHAQTLVTNAAFHASLDETPRTFAPESWMCDGPIPSNKFCEQAMPEAIPSGVEITLQREFREPVFVGWSRSWQDGMVISTGFYAPYVPKQLVGAP
jgi:hypothetical protein